MRPQLLRAAIGVQGNHSRPPSSSTCANSRSAQAARSHATSTIRAPSGHRNRGPNTPPARGQRSARPSETPPQHHRGCSPGEAHHPNSNRTRNGPTRGRPTALRAFRDAPSARGRCDKSKLRLVACKFLTAAPSARLEPRASASVVQKRPRVTGGHSAARGRGMGARSRSVLLLVAAPLAVHAAGGARAAAGLRRAAHKATTASTAKKPSAGPTPAQRVLDAMRLSLQRWAPVTTKRGAQDYVRNVLMGPAKRGALGRILILNGRVFANDEGGKVKQHLAMVSRAVRERHSKVKNVAYLHNSEASGSCIQNKKGELLPTTLIAKKYSSKECGVLVPNPYFGDLDHWSNVAQLLEAASRKHPYWKRDPRAFWRGHIRWRNKDCDHESGNIARFLGTLLTLKHPDRFASGPLRREGAAPRGKKDSVDELDRSPRDEVQGRHKAPVPWHRRRAHRSVIGGPGRVVGRPRRLRAL